MKKLFLASLAIAALASCSKESTVDATITTLQTPMSFSAYAGSVTTKGNPVDTNAEFKGGSDTEDGNAFSVSAYFNSSSDSPSNSGKYFAFSSVEYDYVEAEWENEKDMYWPNEDGTLYFGAYYPNDDTGISSALYEYDSAHKLSMSYAVADAVADQKDLMYAIKTLSYTNGTTDADKVNLHFKHALTQIAFTATKDDDISVSVSEIHVCNIVESGSFVASSTTDDTYTTDETAAANVSTNNFGVWTLGSTQENYAADMDFAGTNTSIAIAAGATATNLTDAFDALMLLPQSLTAWNATTKSDDDSGSYLAIKCTIKHVGTDIAASIIDGYVFIPFDTNNIDYNSDGEIDEKDAKAWLQGYKITYNLHFGGGYTGPTVVPDPGKVPDSDSVVETLRPITYTTTVDEWIPVNGSVAL